MLGSLPLLSFQIGRVEPFDNITRKFAFKVSKILMEGQCMLGGQFLIAHHMVLLDMKNEYVNVKYIHKQDINVFCKSQIY